MLQCSFILHVHTDFEGVSRMLTFDKESMRGAVRIAIFDDVEREVALEMVNLQLSFVEEERNNNLLLLPRQAVATIMDDDGLVMTHSNFCILYAYIILCRG